MSDIPQSRRFLPGFIDKPKSQPEPVRPMAKDKKSLIETKSLVPTKSLMKYDPYSEQDK